jgi:hypothetical protein
MFSLTQNIHYKPPIQSLNYSQSARSTPKKQPFVGVFGGTMINRIHNIRPGCGSCGK